MTERVFLKPWGLYTIGKWIERLQVLLEQSVTYWSPANVANSPKHCLEHLLDLRETKHLDFIGVRAESFLSKFNEKYWKADAYLDSPDREELKSHVSRWEGRLEEISKEWILSYPETHIDARKLTKGVKAFLTAEEFNALEPLERQGLDEAASSLLFNNFISAEFVALRTAESLLKRWYEKRTSKKLGRTTWGEVLEKINEEFPKQKRSKELLLLDYLRERRNEIAHPEGTSGPEEASTTFFNVISLCKSLHLYTTWVKVDKLQQD